MSDLLDMIEHAKCLKEKAEASAQCIDTVYSQHLGEIYGGKATLIITFDDEPRMTRRQWEEWENSKTMKSLRELSDEN